MIGFFSDLLVELLNLAAILGTFQTKITTAFVQMF